MQLLEPTDLAALRPLLADAPHDLAVAAIAAGDAAGLAYADDPVTPSVALVSPHWGRLYVLGRATPQARAAVRALLADVVRPTALAAGARIFTLTYATDWLPHIPDVLGDPTAWAAPRQYYRWSGAVLPPARLPAGFTLAPADADLLGDRRITGLHLLEEEMASERASVADFLARSFGLAPLAGDQLAGWCLSEYNTGHRCEVGIATLEPFQRHGLATAVGRAFIDAARARGIAEVGWHCWTQNAPSAATARKIGLQLVTEYTVHLSWYHPADAAG